MTDQEIVATFMEPDYRKTQVLAGELSIGKWWIRGKIAWFAREITLNECHEVEARLTDEQWSGYATLLETERMKVPFASGAMNQRWRLLHASAEQKIKALAAVLRPVVEGEAERG